MSRRDLVGQAIVFLLVVAVGWGVFRGGFWWTSDVTNAPEYWGTFQPSQTYALARDVFVKNGHGTGEPTLVPEANYKGCHSKHNSAPPSVADYRVNGHEPAQQGILGVVPAGTRLQIARLDHRRMWSWWFGYAETLTVYAMILDGSFAGRVVDLVDVSVPYKHPTVQPFVYRPEKPLLRATTDAHAESIATCS